MDVPLNVLEAGFSPSGLRVALVACRANRERIAHMIEETAACLRRHGIAREDIAVVMSPTPFDLLRSASLAAESPRFDAVIVLAALEAGDTPENKNDFSLLNNGMSHLILHTSKPVGVGVDFFHNVEDGLEPGHGGGPGEAAAMSVLEMCALGDMLSADGTG